MSSLPYSTIITFGKRLFYGLWVLALLFFLIAFIKDPNIVSPEVLIRFIRRYEDTMLLVYIIVSLVRGFFLIPSTPFVIGGALLFPDQLLMVLLISMLGIMVSATSLYYFSDLLGFSQYLEKKHPKGVQTWKTRLKQPNAAFLVFGWALFPLVPTDLICYVAGIVKMPFKYLFIGVFAGEIILVVTYIYFGASIPI